MRRMIYSLVWGDTFSPLSYTISRYLPLPVRVTTTMQPCDGSIHLITTRWIEWRGRELRKRDTVVGPVLEPAPTRA